MYQVINNDPRFGMSCPKLCNNYAEAMEVQELEIVACIMQWKDEAEAKGNFSQMVKNAKQAIVIEEIEKEDV